MIQMRTRFLMQSQIENAMKVTRSNRAAARYLRVSYNFYKRFAKAYKNKEGISLFQAHLNQSGKGVSKLNGQKKPKYTLDDVLLGKCPTYSRSRLLRRLIGSGYMDEKCNHCGFCQKRPTDLKVPLVLSNINGIKTDFRRENLEILCYNCYFILIGDLSRNDFKGSLYNDAPEQTMNTVDSMLESEEHAAALKSMDLLTDEEKQDLLNSLRDL